jgi:hypothetical protein
MLPALGFKGLSDIAHGFLPFLFGVNKLNHSVGQVEFSLFDLSHGSPPIFSGSKGLHPVGQDFTGFLFGKVKDVGKIWGCAEHINFSRFP